MKKVILITSFLLFTLLTYAVFAKNPKKSSKTDKNSIVLVVPSDGSSYDEAVLNGLRNAIEQSYGAFVSSNTTILNDELVKDEIVTVSNGYVRSYEVLSSTRINDKYFVTTQVSVDVGKLVKYAQSKGAEAELAGNIFNKNVQLEALRRRNEVKIMSSLMFQIKELLPDCYDASLTLGQPVMRGNKCAIDIKVEFVPNENMDVIMEMLKSTVGWKKQTFLGEQDQYKSTGGLCVPYDEYSQGVKSGFRYSDFTYGLENSYYAKLRNRYKNDFLLSFLNNHIFSFAIVDNKGNYTQAQSREQLSRNEIKYDKCRYYGSGLFENGVIINTEIYCLAGPKAYIDPKIGYSYPGMYFPTKMSYQFTVEIPLSEISEYSKFEILQNQKIRMQDNKPRQRNGTQYSELG